MMNKRGSLIIASIVFSLLVGVFSSNYAVNSYQTLTDGDQLLYSVEIYDEYHGDQSTLAVDAQYNESLDNWYYVYHDSITQNELRSYVTSGVVGSIAYANHTRSSYGRYQESESTSYIYNFISEMWEEEYYDSSFHYDDVRESFFEASSYDVYSTVLNLDVTTDFGGAIYIGSEFENVTINGVEQELYLDKYGYSEAYSYEYDWSYYDINYIHYEYYEYNFTFYIDNSTGTLIRYFLDMYDSYDHEFEGFSSILGCFVSGHEHGEYIGKITWLLRECSFAYYPVTDADIPAFGMISCNDLTDLTPDLFIAFALVDFGDIIDFELFVDGVPYTYLSNVPAGIYSIVIPETYFEYWGPYSYYEIQVELYDSNNVNHNSTWRFWVEDFRTRVPEWPCYIEGPTVIQVVEGDFNEWFDIYADTNWTLNVYKYDYGTSVWNHYETWEGYLNDTYWLWDYGLMIGNYSYRLELLDDGGNYFEHYLNVGVIPGTPPGSPVIEGPHGDFYYSVGTPKILYYQLFDDDPSYYEVYLNDSLILNGDYYDGDWVNVYLEEYIFGSATFYLEFYAYDFSGHESTLYLKIHAEGEIIDITDPVINSPDQPIYLKIHDPMKLKWEIYDDHPGYFSVKQNGTEIMNEIWHYPSYVVEIDLSTLGIGHYFFEIYVEDDYYNYAVDTVEVYVSEDGSSNTTTDDTTTIGIDAPNILIITLSFVCLSVVPIMLRKRK